MSVDLSFVNVFAWQVRVANESCVSSHILDFLEHTKLLRLWAPEKWIAAPPPPCEVWESCNGQEIHLNTAAALYTDQPQH